MPIDLHELEAIKRLKYKFLRCLDQMRWDEIATWLLITTFVVVVGWQMLHLHLPNR